MARLSVGLEDYSVCGCRFGSAPSAPSGIGWHRLGLAARHPDLSTGLQDLDFGNGPKWGPVGVKWDW
jgi:hypothetical protein